MTGLTPSLDRYAAFLGIVEALLRSGGRLVALIEAYFDESGSHEGSSILCVAGYVIEKQNAQRLSEEWSAVLSEYDLPYFHMVDCAHGNGVFKGMSKPHRIMVAARMIGIIKRSAALGFAQSIDVKAYTEVIPPKLRLFGTPYSFCARTVLDQIGASFYKRNFKGKSAYFFEAGHKSRSEADRIICDLFENPLIDLVYKHGYVGHSFVLKKESPPIQAADILAWHWATHVKRSEAGILEWRRDFKSLADGGLHAHHFSRERLPKYVEILRKFEVDSDHSKDSLQQQFERSMKIMRAWAAAMPRDQKISVPSQAPE
ncbi:MAG TPA: DUF3800 domain-containing protein [Rhizomicrobium sp.]|jgi:hypothetical protein|nr:DUF3800 domain-containing protein [Rhizomicrobium sp.]